MHNGDGGSCDSEAAVDAGGAGRVEEVQQLLLSLQRHRYSSSAVSA
jgi:hypothetical protein